MVARVALGVTLAGCAAPTGAATEVVSFTPGEGAGFGQSALPDVVLGPPHGSGDSAGSTDVLSLGRGGEIVLAFDADLVDGDGPDLRVFENPFSGFVETAEVAVGDDLATWHAWPCLPVDGCAGVNPVFSSPENGIDPASEAAGGDAFDLADLGLDRARYVRITDSGENAYEGQTGGFDLDAVVLVHFE